MEPAGYKHFVPPGLVFSMRKTLLKTLAPTAMAMIAATSLAVDQAQPRRATTTLAPADILRIANVSDAQISPNGQWVVYAVATVNGDETVSTLWLARLGTTISASTSTVPPTSPRRPTTDWERERSAPTPLLAAGWNASNPRWSPDSSKIAFLSDHDDQHGLWVVNLDKREPRFIASLQSTNFFITYAGESFAWAPDAKRIAYISATEESPHDDLVPGTPARASNDPRVIDRIQYKSRTSFSDNRRTHVWITGIDKPDPQQLTSGPYYDHAITFSPNEDEIAFLSNHEADPDANNNSDIFAVNLSGQVRQITATRGCEYEPTWSPDGKWIAYTATKRDVTTIDSVAEDTHVWVISASGSNSRELTGAQDRRARDPRWTHDGNSVLYLAGDRGSTTIYRVDISSRHIEAFMLPVDAAEHIHGAFMEYKQSSSDPDSPFGAFQISSFSIAQQPISAGATSGGNDYPPIAFTLSADITPVEVYVAGGKSLSIVRPSAHNEPVRSLYLVPSARIDFKSFDGMPVQGWLIKPIGWRSDRKYPLILSIHGGPHGMSGYAFNPTFQV